MLVCSKGDNKEIHKSDDSDSEECGEDNKSDGMSERVCLLWMGQGGGLVMVVEQD